MKERFCQCLDESCAKVVMSLCIRVLKTFDSPFHYSVSHSSRLVAGCESECTFILRCNIVASVVKQIFVCDWNVIHKFVNFSKNTILTAICHISRIIQDSFIYNQTRSTRRARLSTPSFSSSLQYACWALLVLRV